MPEREDGPMRTDCDPAAEEPQAPTSTVTPTPEGSGFSAPSVGPGAGSSTTPEGSGFSAPSGGPGAGSSTAPDEEPADFVPARVGCRTELRGWAGAHLHGAVRPRRRTPGRGRPPGRWC
jgi:hypothetical protein